MISSTKKTKQMPGSFYLEEPLFVWGTGGVQGPSAGAIPDVAMVP